MKVLFDALRLPQNCDEVIRKDSDAESDEPLFVLIEDDRLIVELRVTTDRLLVPPTGNEHVNDVRLVINVKTVVMQASKWGGLLYA